MNPKTSDISFAPFINFRRLQAMTFWTYFLSIADGILTIFWTKSNLATEANPLMDQLLIYHPVLFMAVKIALVSLGITLLWRLRFHPLATLGIVLSFAVYCIIIIHHIRFIA